MDRFNATGVHVNETFSHPPESNYVHLYMAYNLLFIVGGFGGNILILSAVKLNNKLHNFGSVFICSLSLSDLCVVVLADGFTLIGILTDGKTLLNNPHLCIWTSFFCLSACFCSFWNIAAGSIHTYLHVCQRFFYIKHVKALKIGTAVACIWTGTALLLLPSVFGWGNHVYDTRLMYCVFEYTFYAPYTIFLVIMGTILPLSLTTVAYAGIFHTVIKSRNKLRRNENFAKLTKSAMNPVEARLMRSLLAIAVYVGITWSYLIVIWVFGDMTYWSDTEMVVAMLMAHSHCGLNAVLYIVTNKTIREGVKNIFRKKEDSPFKSSRTKC